jgi:hypothetical protein
MALSPVVVRTLGNRRLRQEVMCFISGYDKKLISSVLDNASNGIERLLFLVVF